jgi:3-methyladenine DNA glycosylase/8-oxoguanine DNA glycosylase
VIAMTTATALPLQRVYRPAEPVDLHATLGAHKHGPHDPCHHIDKAGAHWRTWRTPDGPATVRFAAGNGEVSVEAWGSGAGWALEAAPALLGAGDDWTGLELDHAVLRDTRRGNPGLRLSRSHRVFEALVPAVIEQLVSGVEAFRSWRQLVNRFGDAAPGPVPVALKVFPEAQVLREIPDWEWHRIGLDGRRRRTVIAAAHVARRLDECAYLDIETSAKRLRSLPGVGQWTVAETLQRSHGAPDLVSVGDYHIPNIVGFALTGAPRTDDEGMLALLAPYAGHRQRVVRLLEASGRRAPRFGPRAQLRDYRRL